MAVLLPWLLKRLVSQDLVMYGKETAAGTVLRCCYGGIFPSVHSPWLKSCLLQSSLCTFRAEAFAGCFIFSSRY